MSFLQPSDFRGIVAQSKNEFTEPKIQSYIDEFEKKYLTSLLGCDMYKAFIDDLDTAPNITPTSVPQDAKFLVIFNEFCMDDTDCKGKTQQISEGFKKMLKYFVFFEYARDNQFDFNITGATKNRFSNSELVSINHTNAIRNYNLGIKTYEAIQWYVCKNPDSYDYDSYNGIKKEYITWL